jgi:hypothetical protein
MLQAYGEQEQECQLMCTTEQKKQILEALSI